MKKCAVCDEKTNPQAKAMFKGEHCDNCGKKLTLPCQHEYSIKGKTDSQRWKSINWDADVTTVEVKCGKCGKETTEIWEYAGLEDET